MTGTQLRSRRGRLACEELVERAMPSVTAPNFIIESVTLTLPIAETVNRQVTLIEADGTASTQLFTNDGVGEFTADIPVFSQGYTTTLRVTETTDTLITYFDYDVTVSDRFGSNLGTNTPISGASDSTFTSSISVMPSTLIPVGNTVAQLSLDSNSPVQVSVGTPRTSYGLLIPPPPIVAPPVVTPMPPTGAATDPTSPPTTPQPPPPPSGPTNNDTNSPPPALPPPANRGPQTPVFNGLLLAHEQHEFHSLAVSTAAAVSPRFERAVTFTNAAIRVADDRVDLSNRLPIFSASRSFTDSFADLDATRRTSAFTSTIDTARIATSSRSSVTHIERGANSDWFFDAPPELREEFVPQFRIANEVIHRLAERPLGEAPFPDALPTAEPTERRSRLANWFSLLAVTTFSWTMWRRSASRETKRPASSFGLFE